MQKPRNKGISMYCGDGKGYLLELSAAALYKSYSLADRGLYINACTVKVKFLGLVSPNDWDWWSHRETVCCPLAEIYLCTYTYKTQQ